MPRKSAGRQYLSTGLLTFVVPTGIKFLGMKAGLPGDGNLQKHPQVSQFQLKFLFYKGFIAIPSQSGGCFTETIHQLLKIELFDPAFAARDIELTAAVEDIEGIEVEGGFRPCLLDNGVHLAVLKNQRKGHALVWNRDIDEKTVGWLLLPPEALAYCLLNGDALLIFTDTEQDAEILFACGSDKRIVGNNVAAIRQIAGALRHRFVGVERNLIGIFWYFDLRSCKGAAQVHGAEGYSRPKFTSI